MTSKNVANVGSIVTDKTIDSQSLLEMVNQARKQCGEKEVRNNVFMDRIKDELEGEFYKIFVKPSGGIGGRPVEVAEMSKVNYPCRWNATMQTFFRLAIRKSASQIFTNLGVNALNHQPTNGIN